MELKKEYCHYPTTEKQKQLLKEFEATDKDFRKAMHDGDSEKIADAVSVSQVKWEAYLESLKEGTDHG